MILTLKNATVQAAVNTLGAELVSLKRADGFELLWQGDPAHWGGQAPVLFPIVGALRGGKAQIQGQWCEMGRHGFARRMEFTPTLQGDDSVALTLYDSQATKGVYPFSFALTVSYRLCEKGITTEFVVHNRGEVPLPFVVGGHPGYNIPLVEGEQFTDYVIAFEKPETQTCPAIDLQSGLIDFSKSVFQMQEQAEIPLTHALFQQDALVFSALRSHRVCVKSTKSGQGLCMDFTGFPLLGIWSAVSDAPFVALEPWTGCATAVDEGDVFEEKRGITWLPVGACKKLAFTTTYFK